MSYSVARNALQKYHSIGVHTGVEHATAHRLIQMLMDGALARIASARGHIQRGQIAEKGEQIGLAVSIVDGLRASLNVEKGGDIAVNLERLYDYITRRLLEANIANDDAALAEVSDLIRELKAGWDGIEAAPAGDAPVQSSVDAEGASVPVAGQVRA
jgi:flagellar secretion chaperone FliS